MTFVLDADQAHYVTSYSGGEFGHSTASGCENAAFGVYFKYVDRVSVQDGGGLDRSSKQSDRGRQLALITRDVTLN